TIRRSCLAVEHSLGYDPHLPQRWLRFCKPSERSLEASENHRGSFHFMNLPAQVQSAPLLREYYSRVLAYIATAASIAAGTYAQHFAYDILWMVPYALLYPHLAHHLSN